MADPQAWRELREQFSSVTDRSIWAFDLGTGKGWNIPAAPDSESVVRFRTYASAGARQLRCPRSVNGGEWSYWLSSIRSEPLMAGHVQCSRPSGAAWSLDDAGARDADVAPISRIDDVCAASVEYCGFLASGAVEAPNGAMRAAEPVQTCSSRPAHGEK
jgi:hypothetical protein